MGFVVVLCVIRELFGAISEGWVCFCLLSASLRRVEREGRERRERGGDSLSRFPPNIGEKGLSSLNPNNILYYLQGGMR